MVHDYQLHKLLGVSYLYLRVAANLFAREYIRIGGINRGRVSGTHDQAGIVTGSDLAGQIWSDADVEDIPLILRRSQEINAQLRNRVYVRELKRLYENTCTFCGERTVVGVEPDHFYSEVAHIKPVGAPHGGPDIRENMLVLCPKHHLQLDRGVLSFGIIEDHSFEVLSKIPDDPLHQSRIHIRSPHSIHREFVEWHVNYWSN